MSDNKQKIIKLLLEYVLVAQDSDLWFEDDNLFTEIDALYNRDCGKCKNMKEVIIKETCRLYCKHNTTDYYEEVTE